MTRNASDCLLNRLGYGKLDRFGSGWGLVVICCEHTDTIDPSLYTRAGKPVE
jgi:hypothetical protein